MKDTIFRIAFTASAAAISAYFGEVFIPVLLLLGVMIADYCTGIIKAFFLGEVSSKAGLKGILKKISYLLVVCVGICVDWILQSAFEKVGIAVETSCFICLIVVVWLIINECISILENLTIIGVPMPDFLVKVVQKLKVYVEKKAKEETQTNDDEGSGE